MLSLGPRTYFKWKQVRSPCFGKVGVPIARIFLKKKSGEWQEFWVDVDSGAVVSFFNKDDCETLGYDLKIGSFCEIKGVGGNVLPCYIHTLDMKIGDEVIATRIAFSDTPKHSLLLGRLDVFTNFEIDLRGKTLDSFFARDF